MTCKNISITLRIQVIMLKSLWDMITVVKTSIEDWKTTKWANINVEQMEIDCKKFAQEIRGLDKEVKLNAAKIRRVCLNVLKSFYKGLCRSRFE